MVTAALPAVVPEPVLRLVDPSVEESELSVEDLGSRIVGLAGRLAAATCQWLLMVAQFDARDGCARFGLASTARWLTHCCGLSHRTAVDHVRVARALASFPALATAMSAGRVSYSHVRAIARVATAGEDRTVADLLEVAESGTVGQLETVVRGLRTVEDAEGQEYEDSGPPSRGRPAEYVRARWSSTSHWQLGARLDPERGALVQKAIDTLRAVEGLTGAEALERIAEIALAVLADAGRAPSLRGEERAAVVVRLDLDTARRFGTDGGVPGTDSSPPPAGDPTARADPADPANFRSRLHARIDDGPGLPVHVLERLLCDGRLRTSLHRTDGSMFDLGRTRRVVSTRLFRALLHRDGCCAHPGCTSRAGLEAHHVRHWLHGGRTDLANLVLLCRRHHHAHHDDEFSIGERPDGSFMFLRADGRELERHVDPARLLPAAPSVPAAAEALQAPNWTGTGERLDRHYAISVLAQRRHAAPREDGRRDNMPGEVGARLAG